MFGMNCSRAPGCVTPRARARVGLTVGLALVLTFAHANPFASPEPPPPPSSEVLLPPEFDVDLPALPTPPLDAPEVAAPLSPEERLEEALPDLTRPALEVAPQAPALASVPTPLTPTPSYELPDVLANATAHQAALEPSTAFTLQNTLDATGVTLTGIIHGSAPQALLDIEGTSYVLPYGATLPGKQIRITDVREDSIVLTFEDASIELTLAGEVP